jgi:integrase
MSVGTIKRDPVRKTWYFVVDVRSADGKRHQLFRRGFRTRADAQEELDKRRAATAKGVLVDGTLATVGEYLRDVWLPSLASTVRPTTLDTYRRLVWAHVMPTLGPLRLQQLERAHVRQWVDRLARQMSPKSVRNVHGVLAKALADAVDLQLVDGNVASRTRLPSVERGAPRAWSASQLSAFLERVGGDRLYPLWRVVAMTGCRRGEALGLRWADVDLEEATLTITNQRTIAGSHVVEGSPKTKAGARTVALDAGTVAALRAWRAQQASERLVMGAGWPDNGLVFTNPDGGGLWPQRVTARFRAIAAELELPPIGVHGLRHSAATWMIGAGVSPKLVQQRLGHADVSVTLGLYSHVMPGHDHDAAEALANAVAHKAVASSGRNSVIKP